MDYFEAPVAYYSLFGRVLRANGGFLKVKGWVKGSGSREVVIN